MVQGETQSSQAGWSDEGEQLARVAITVRTVLQTNRSDKLLRLFDYLLAKSLRGEAPSEQQIAAEAFVDDSTVEGLQEANVRVYAHRLRKLIDSTFVGKSGPSIEIPVGSYCIRLIDDGEAALAPLASRKPGVFGHVTAQLRRLPIMLVGFIILLAGVLALVLVNRDITPLSRTVAWQSFKGSARPLTIVIGDYYLFASLDSLRKDAEAAPRLVWDRSVLTREDLTIFQILNPTAADSTIDYNQQFVSGGTIAALSEVRSTIAQVPALERRPLRLIAGSRLTPEILKDSDIIYVGQFSGMPILLRDPLAQASGYKMSFGFDALIDKDSAKSYQSDGMILTDERIARRDFAYLAGFPGPAGNQILIIAGLGDAGLKEAAKTAGNPEQLRAVKTPQSELKKGFEALYRVRTIKNVNVGATVVQDRALRSEGMWDNSGNVRYYRPIKANKPLPDPVDSSGPGN